MAFLFGDKVRILFSLTALSFRDSKSSDFTACYHASASVQQRLALLHDRVLTVH